MAKASSHLRQLRIDRGLTQVQLACRAGLGSRTVQLAESGTSVSPRTLRRIAGALEVEDSVVFHCTETDRTDGYMRLPYSVGEHVPGRSLPHHGRLCRSVAEVCDVIQQMRDNFVLQINRCECPKQKRRFEKLNERIDSQYFRYEQRYVEMWRRVPDSIVIDEFEGKPAGVSIVVPLTKSSFREFCLGQRSFVDLGVDDLRPQSQHLLLDSVTEFPNVCSRPWYQITQSLSFITFSQIARLSRHPQARDFAMASFCASDLNQRRLISMGFVLENATMPEFGYDLCRFGSLPRDTKTDNYAEVVTMKYFAGLIKSLDIATIRQQLVKAALQMIKRRQANVSPMQSVA